MREHQLHFSDYDPLYPRRISLVVKDFAQQIYDRTLGIWNRLDLPLTENPYQGGTGTFVSPTFSHRHPRICDVEIPEPIKPLLTRFGEAKRTGSKTNLPVPLIDLLPDICAEVYGQYPLDDKVEDHYGFLSLMPGNFNYHHWLSSWWSDWWDNPQHIGWGVSMANIPKKDDFTSLSFSLTRKLKRFSTTRQYPSEISRFPNPGLTTIATFRGNSLYSLWQEELNNAFNRVRSESRIHRRIWSTIDQRPLDKKAVYQLVDNGLHIVTDPNYDSATYYDNKILLGGAKDLANPYQRDLAILHELAHAWYGYELNDGYGLGSQEKENRILVNWIARKARANPITLRAAILGLYQKPQIYDKASFLAFSSKPYFITPIPSPIDLIEHIVDIRYTLMD